MAYAQWDRLLETCYRRGSELLFVAGSPPMIRGEAGWGPVGLPPLLCDDVKALAAERLAGGGQTDAAGYASADFWYGDVAYFRAMAFGFPDTVVLIVTRIPPPAELPWRLVSGEN